MLTDHPSCLGKVQCCETKEGVEMQWRLTHLQVYSDWRDNDSAGTCQREGPSMYLKGLETFKWHSRSSSDELHQQSKILLVEAAHNLPKPLDDWRGSCVATILGVVAQVLDVNLWQATDQQLELVIVED